MPATTTTTCRLGLLRLASWRFRPCHHPAPLPRRSTPEYCSTETKHLVRARTCCRSGSNHRSGGAQSAHTAACGSRRRNSTTTSSSSTTTTSSSTGRGSVLFLSPTLWPEPSSSAAGVRTTALLRHFAGSDDPDPSDPEPLPPPPPSVAGRRPNNNDEYRQERAGAGAQDDSWEQPPPLFDTVHYGSGASQLPPPTDASQHFLHRLSTEHGIELHSIPANRTSTIQSLLTTHPAFDALSAVVFDRFHAEEVYSHHVRRCKPDALRILDMQDFHSLRRARQALVEEYDGTRLGGLGSSSSSSSSSPWMTDTLMDTVMGCVPSHHSAIPPTAIPTDTKKKRPRRPSSTSDRARTTLLRELASIHRSDLVLVCSSHEYDLLTDTFRIHPHKLCHAPFFTDEVVQPCYDDNDDDDDDDDDDEPQQRAGQRARGGQFDHRTDFVVLGGYNHPPNVDSVRWLHAEVWPLIRSALPDVRVHVWGSYPTPQIWKLNEPRNGFYVGGRLPPDGLGEELSRRRVLLAPLRYGAGIKGKVVDAWRYGCPVVTTPVGAEGTTMMSASGSGGSGSGSGSADWMQQCTVRSGGQTTTSTTPKIDDVGWGGLVGTDAAALARCAVRLYTDVGLWDEARSNAGRLLRVLFDRNVNLTRVDDAIRMALEEMEERRAVDHVGAALWHSSVRSTEYFSRWIELKETGGRGGGETS